MSEQMIAASVQKSEEQTENETKTENSTQKFNGHIEKSQKVLKSILLMNRKIEKSANDLCREANELKPIIKEIENSLETVASLQNLAEDVSRVHNNLCEMFHGIDEVLISLSKVPEGFQQHLRSICNEVKNATAAPISKKQDSI